MQKCSPSSNMTKCKYANGSNVIDCSERVYVSYRFGVGGSHFKSTVGLVQRALGGFGVKMYLKIVIQPSPKFEMFIY